jgi:hypothetical protein
MYWAEKEWPGCSEAEFRRAEDFSLDYASIHPGYILDIIGRQ